MIFSKSRYLFFMLTAVFALGIVSCSEDSITTPQLDSHFKIAYISQRDGINELYVMDGDGQEQQQFTDGAEITVNSAPVWSPDGTKILFAGTTSLGSRLFVAELESPNLTQLTNVSVSAPAWSPDGNSIAFTSNTVSGRGTFVMNADGTGVTLISSSFSNNIAWSPDGTSLALEVNNGPGTENHSDIYLINADGSGQTRLTSSEFDDRNPSWSPDGTKILWLSLREFNERKDISVMNSDGSNPVNLTNNADAEWDPLWSPDGSKILFRSYRDGNHELYTMDPDGSNITRLTNEVAADVSASWSQDGKYIIFASDRDDFISFQFVSTTEIYIMNADGSNQIRLTRNGDMDLNAAASPIIQ